MAGLAEVLAATSATPSRDAARGEGLSHLGRALELLPTDYRRAVSLYDLEGRSIKTVAAELGRSPGAVWMFRARAHDRPRNLMGSPQRFFSTPG